MAGQLRTLEHQVAGHPGSVLTSEDGSFIVKPSLPLECQFYEVTAPRHFPELAAKALIPAYYGQQEHTAPPKEGKVKIEQAIKLENLTHGFVKPNVIDLKLGTQLFDPLDPNLTPDKQARMEAESARTTSGSDGVRLTGFSVYDKKTDTFVATPKAYGKAIPSSELANGIRRFFPCSDELASIHSAHELTPPPPSGLPASVLVPLVRAICEKVVEFRQTTEAYEWRIYGGSLLIVYEGNPSASSSPNMPKFNLKVIDFAHTRHLPGEGPDAGLLKGTDSVIRLLTGRLQELEQIVQA